MIKKFKDFLPFYLNAHQNKTSQLLHFVGADVFILGILLFLIFLKIWILVISISLAYILPGIGHSHFEKNKSMRTSHPLYCILGACYLYFAFLKNLLLFKIHKK